VANVGRVTARIDELVAPARRRAAIRISDEIAVYETEIEERFVHPVRAART